MPSGDAVVRPAPTPWAWLSADSEAGRRFFQERVALFARISATLSFGFYLALNLLFMLFTRDYGSQWVTEDGNRVHLAVIAVFLLTWLACRRSHLAMTVLGLLDGVCLALVGAGYGAMGWAAAPVDPLDIAMYASAVLLACTVTYVGRAFLVPSTAMRTVVVTGASALMALGGIQRMLSNQAAGMPGGQIAFLLGYHAAWLLLAVVTATIASAIIFGLRQEVRAARQLGQYTLLEKLGEGGMGEVYRARHALMRRPVAIKLLPAGKTGERSFARFEREVQLTSALTHPSTIAIFDYGRTASGTFYYVMEYLDGVSFEQLVREDGPQPPARVIHLLVQACGSLIEAHAVGLVHRDIKPANLMLCERGGVPDVVKVVDFGLVKDLGNRADIEVSTADTIAGTPHYLAPEAIRAPDALDARSDLYSLGAVAYHLLAGRRLFDGSNLIEICGHHLHSVPEAPSSRLGRPLPEDLERLVLACLAKEPSSRPADARRLRDALLACKDSGSWREEQAQAWWRRLRDQAPARLRPAGSASLEVVSGLPTVDIELRRRD